MARRSELLEPGARVVLAQEDDRQDERGESAKQHDGKRIHVASLPRSGQFTHVLNATRCRVTCSRGHPQATVAGEEEGVSGTSARSGP